jgi:hypothetical protein
MYYYYLLLWLNDSRINVIEVKTFIISVSKGKKSGSWLVKWKQFKRSHKISFKPGKEAHTLNLGYISSVDQEDYSLRPAWAKC